MADPVPKPRKPSRDAYRRGQFKARQAAGDIGQLTAAKLESSIDEFARRLERAMSSVGTRQDLRELYADSFIITQKLLRELHGTLEESIANGVGVTYQSVAAIWEEAGRRAAFESGVDLASLGRLRPPALTTLSAFQEVGGAKHWRTLLRGHGLNAEEQANAILRGTILEGVAPVEVGRRMRRYVEGAEDFEHLFSSVPTLSGDVLKVDLRTVPHFVRDAMGQMRLNSERIAFSEMRNARHASQVEEFVRDPFVEAVRWRLSPNRGKSFTPPDECDILASVDYYGLGGGVYPVGAVPGVPHPFDRCENEPIIRDPDDFEKPKPRPDRIRSAVGLLDKDPIVTRHNLREFGLGALAAMPEDRAVRFMTAADRAVAFGEGIFIDTPTGLKVAGKAATKVVQAEAAKVAASITKDVPLAGIAAKLAETEARYQGVLARHRKAQVALSEEYDLVNGRYLKAQARFHEELDGLDDEFRRVRDSSIPVLRDDTPAMAVRRKMDDLKDKMKEALAAIEDEREVAYTAQKRLYARTERLARARRNVMWDAMTPLRTLNEGRTRIRVSASRPRKTLSQLQAEQKARRRAFDALPTNLQNAARDPDYFMRAFFGLSDDVGVTSGVAGIPDGLDRDAVRALIAGAEKKLAAYEKAQAAYNRGVKAWAKWDDYETMLEGERAFRRMMDGRWLPDDMAAMSQIPRNKAQRAYWSAYTHDQIDNWSIYTLRGKGTREFHIRGASKMGEADLREAIKEAQGAWLGDTARSGARVVVHEMGHGVEHWHPEVMKASVELWERRTGKPFKSKGLTKLPGAANGIGDSDQFMHYYTGRWYPEGTEVLSTGLEYITADPLDLLLHDPDHWAYVVRIMNGAVDNSAWTLSASDDLVAALRAAREAGNDDATLREALRKLTAGDDLVPGWWK